MLKKNTVFCLVFHTYTRKRQQTAVCLHLSITNNHQMFTFNIKISFVEEFFVKMPNNKNFKTKPLCRLIYMICQIEKSTKKNTKILHL